MISTIECCIRCDNTKVHVFDYDRIVGLCADCWMELGGSAQAIGDEHRAWWREEIINVFVARSQAEL